ncbi:uncharacterized protein [Dysidea avara]|uniref:uncharacterized protein n=1 Tax=Dysidea avara TaxID=196820 RepID=UPI003334834F
MYFSVTTTTQPSDVAVPSGGTAVFTCVVDLRDRNANTDDIKWDSMGNAITRASTDPYMVENDFEEGDQLISTLTIKNVNTQHAGLYQFVLSLNDCDVMSREAFLTILTAVITTQPSDITVCNGGAAVFTCVVDRNGTDITSDDVMWQQMRMNGGISTLYSSLTGRVPFNITTTISGDILTSTLTVTGVTDSNVLGTSLYRCVVNDLMSRNASPLISTDTTGPPGTPINIRVSEISSTSFVVQWDEVDDADHYIVNWRDDGGSVRESTTSLISITITQLSPNTTYNVTVTAGNICGSGTVSDILIVTSNVTLLVGPSITTLSLVCTSISSTMMFGPSITTLSLVTSSTMMLLTASASSAPCVYMPTQSQSDSSSLSTGVAVAVTFTITFIITLTVSVVITFLITFVIVKRKFEKIYKTTHQSTQQMPLYETVITPAITKSDVKLEANPAYGTSDRVAMNDNPAYLSCK